MKSGRFFLRSLEYEGLKILHILEKVDHKFDLFSGNRKNSEVNLKPVAISEYM